jgi:transcriptional regulator of acetoin/glycerol metabolism
MASLSRNSTVSMQADPGGPSAPVRPFLFLVLQADRPDLQGARHCLEETDRVMLGRATERTFERQGLGTLFLGLPDRSVSTRHAQLRREGETWLVSDAGSKNGTRLNGTRLLRETSLAAGDWIEVGHSFFLFEPSVAKSAGPRSVDASALLPSLPALGTLSSSFAEELAKLQLVASSKITVLLSGESGTGKEVLAATLHQLSARAGLFEAVNCGALAANLMESELFGYRKGAFSGATEDRPGLIRAADRGTLFLDEIGDLPLPAQASLLRVLQESEVTPVGGTRPIKVDFRLVAATHRDLPALVDGGLFRADLLARLSGFELRLPSLRDRRADLGSLIFALLRRHFPDRKQFTFTTEAARALLVHPWPLNIRELEKCLVTAATLAQSGPIELAHLPAAIRAPEKGGKSAVARSQPTAPLSPEDEALRTRLLALFEEHRGNITAVAAAMGKARNQVQRWVKRLEIDLERWRDK